MTNVTVERVEKALMAVTVETPEVVVTTMTAVTVDRRWEFVKCGIRNNGIAE